VGASAAELLAPDEFKPSTQIKNLFGANNQPEKDPYTALKPDQGSNVAISDSCDLAIKYPKMIDNREMAVFNNTLDLTPEEREAYKGTEIDPQKMIASLSVYHSYQGNIDFNVDRLINSFDIFCYDIAQERNSIISTDYYKSGGDDLNKTSYYEISKEQLKDNYGWFITEADIKNIAVYQTNGLSGNGKSISQTILFDYKNKLYMINVIPEKDNDFSVTLNSKGLFGEQIQLQFSSLVKNEANAEIVQKPTETSAKIQPLVADASHDVVVLKECDLAIRYKKNLEIKDLSVLDNGFKLHTIGFYTSPYDISNEPVAAFGCDLEQTFDD